MQPSHSDPGQTGPVNAHGNERLPFINAVRRAWSGIRSCIEESLDSDIIWHTIRQKSRRGLTDGGSE